MSLLTVLNEKSEGGCRDRTHGLEMLEQLTATLRRVNRDRRISLVSPRPIFGLVLRDDINVGMLTRRGRGRDLGRYLRALQNIAPFSAAPARDGPQDHLHDELFYDGTHADGLTLAWRVEGLAVSFATDPQWDTPRVKLVHRCLDETEDGQLVLLDTAVEVMHASKAEHVDAIDDISELGRRSVPTGTVLWRDRAELFDCIEFLPRVEDEFGELRASGSRLVAVYRTLRAMDRDLSDWRRGDAQYPRWSTKVTPEHRQRKRLCVFTDLDGVDRCFDLHARYTPGPGRIHFLLDMGAKTARVAYVANKIGV